MRRRSVLSALCFAVAFVAPRSAPGESWFRPNPEAVKKWSEQLADKARPSEERIEAVKALRVVFTVYGAYNVEPALSVLKAVRRETREVRAPAAALFDDLQTALKRPDKRLPHNREYEAIYTDGYWRHSRLPSFGKK
jgi:hypothetical protein